MKVTFVSALFDINRVDGRKWDEYLKWFEITLKLRVPMVLFLDRDMQEYIDERRGDMFSENEYLKTQTLYQTVEDIPYYELKNQIQEILDSDQYKKDMADPERI